MIGELLTMARGHPWFKFFPADYLQDTQHLSTTEHGAYILLILSHWSNGKLPDDDEALRRITGLDRRLWKKYKPTLQAFFHSGWRHKRLERDRAEVERLSEIRSTAASKRLSTGCGQDAPVTNRQPKILRHGSGAKPLKYNEAPSANARNQIRKKKDFLSDAARKTRGTPAARPNSLSTNRKRQQARQRWEAGLVHALGPDAFAQALDLFAADPQLADQITDAELRKTGSGVPAALDAIRKRIGGRS